MAGKKGKSGRKPRNDGLKLKPIALYIEHSGKTPIHWFRFFKRVNVRWQEKVRALMQEENAHAKRTRLWRCGCSDPLLHWHFFSVHKCHGCNQWYNEATRRIYER